MAQATCYVGSKYSLVDANNHSFSMAVGGYVKIPVSLVMIKLAPSTMYVVDGTPGTNPLDVDLGMRFFLIDGSIAFGGGYRYAVNSASRRALSVLYCEKVVKSPYPTDPHP